MPENCKNKKVKTMFSDKTFVFKSLAGNAGVNSLNSFNYQ